MNLSLQGCVLSNFFFIPPADASCSGNWFAYSTFINGKFLGSGQGLNATDIVNATLTFPTGTVTSGSNVVTVVMDASGNAPPMCTVFCETVA